MKNILVHDMVVLKIKSVVCQIHTARSFPASTPFSTAWCPLVCIFSLSNFMNFLAEDKSFQRIKMKKHELNVSFFFILIEIELKVTECVNVYTFRNKIIKI